MINLFKLYLKIRQKILDLIKSFVNKQVQTKYFKNALSSDSEAAREHFFQCHHCRNQYEFSLMRITYKYILTVVQIHNIFTTLVYSTQALGLLICYVTRTRVLSTCDLHHFLQELLLPTQQVILLFQTKEACILYILQVLQVGSQFYPTRSSSYPN